MNQTNSGDKELLTVEQLQEKVELLLSEYSQSNGVPLNLDVPEAHKYIGLTLEQLRRLTPTECAEAAYAVANAAAHIQREYNKQRARATWAKNNLDYKIAQKIDTVADKYLPYNIRKMIVINDNNFLLALQKLESQAELRATTLEHMSSYLKTISSTLLTLSTAKRSE